MNVSVSEMWPWHPATSCLCSSGSLLKVSKLVDRERHDNTQVIPFFFAYCCLKRWVASWTTVPTNAIILFKYCSFQFYKYLHVEVNIWLFHLSSEVKSVQSSGPGIFWLFIPGKLNSLTDPQLSPNPADCQTSSSPFLWDELLFPPRWGQPRGCLSRER